MGIDISSDMPSGTINADAGPRMASADSFKITITGKDVTPFLLAKIVEESEGKSLKANIALVYNNAKVGAQIAKAYSKL